MDAFISGAWRTVRRGEVIIGGAVRGITRGEVYHSGAWRTAASFTSPLSVIATNASGRNSNNGRAVFVTSSTSQATPSGGLGPYSYSWVITSGSALITSPNMAATTFGATVDGDTTVTVTARVTCTDALGTTATSNISITLTNGFQ